MEVNSVSGEVSCVTSIPFDMLRVITVLFFCPVKSACPGEAAWS